MIPSLRELRIPEEMSGALVAGDDGEEDGAAPTAAPGGPHTGQLSSHCGGDERLTVCWALSEASTGRVCRTRAPAPDCWSASKETAGLSPDQGLGTAGPPGKNLHQPCLQGHPCTTGCVRSLQLSADKKGPQTGGTTVQQGGLLRGFPPPLADSQASPRVLTPACVSSSRLPLLGRTAVALELGITPSDLTLSLSRPYLRGTPWRSTAQGSTLSLPRATVHSLVGGTKTPQAVQPKQKQKCRHQIQSRSVKMGIRTTLRCEFCGRQ